MANPLETRALDRLDKAGDDGVAMGQLVDALVDEGFDEGAVESVIWQLMQRREATPNGYVRRQLRSAGGAERAESFRRIYEFVLRRWSPDLDAQLEIPGT